MTAGEVNSCLFSPKMGMWEDLPALLEIVSVVRFHMLLLKASPSPSGWLSINPSSRNPC
jgi:hypothetical protein